MINRPSSHSPPCEATPLRLATQTPRLVSANDDYPFGLMIACILSTGKIFLLAFPHREFSQPETGFRDTSELVNACIKLGQKEPIDVSPKTGIFTGRESATVDQRCTIHVEGGLNRPPMERTKAVRGLFTKAKNIGKQMGFSLEESSTGGGSDGNFTAALGVPTLDGVGGVGEGAHAINESILIDRIADRTALLAGLLAGL